MSITSQIEVASEDVKSMEVPEWLINGQPLKIFWTPMTVKDQKKITQRYPDFYENIMNIEVQVHILITKALDEKGDPLLVVMRVASSIIQNKTVEELEKN
jgi:hypothetical protein